MYQQIKTTIISGKVKAYSDSFDDYVLVGDTNIQEFLARFENKSIEMRINLITEAK